MRGDHSEGGATDAADFLAAKKRFTQLPKAGKANERIYRMLQKALKIFRVGKIKDQSKPLGNGSGSKGTSSPEADGPA